MVVIKSLTSVFGPGDYVSIEDKDGRFDLYSCYEMYAATNMVEKNRLLLGHLTAVKNAN